MRRTIFAVTVLTLFLAPWGVAQDARSPRLQNGRATSRLAKDEVLPMITPEREAAALSFVSQHHPELAELLTWLKSGKPAEYRRAIAELFRTSERLAQTQERDTLRYELDLRAWKIDSQIRLLTARLMMADDEVMIEKLKALLNEKVDVQLAVQELERSRVSTRLEKLNTTIAKTQNGRERQVQESLDKLLGGIAQSRPKGKAQRAKAAGTVDTKTKPP